MALGNVDIEPYEEDAEGNPFEQGQPLYPAYVDADNNITCAIDKVVNVKNVGSSEAYVRTLLAFEAGTLSKADFDKYIHTVFTDGTKVEWLPTAIEAKGVKYYVACVDYGAVAAGVETDPSLLKVYMDKEATNKTVAEFGETYEIIALSQAIQTTNMPDAATAWTESFGAFNVANAEKWFNGVSVVPVTTVSTAAELKEALAAGGTIMVVEDIKVTETLNVAAGKNVEIILSDADINYGVDNNGKAAAIINNKGNLTISGNGTLSFVAADPDMAAIPGYATNTITNEATLTIEAGVTVTNGSNGGASYAVDNKGVFYLNGGTLKGERCALRIAKFNQDNVVFVMNGGLVEGATPAWIQLPGSSASAAPTITVTINDGTFKSTKASSADNDVLYTYSFGNSHANTTVTINGGNFLGGTVSIGSGYKGDAPALTINGGTFEHPVLQWLADGTSVQLNDSNVISDSAALADALNNGETSILVGAGTYTIPSAVAGKTVTIVGTGDNTVFDFTKANSVSGASITFENVKFQGKNENVMNGFGIHNTTGHIAYKNCTFDGAVTNEYYGTVSYEDCTFTGTGYITTYAIKSATFKNCTFDKADSRALLVYSHGDNPVKVEVEGCTFKAAAKATTWSGDWTAAVEVDTTNIPTAGTTVTINNCTADENYNGIVRDKSADGKANAVITVDGVAFQN